MSQIWWYIARASGLAAWALVMTSVLLGLLVSGRLTTLPGWRRRLLGWHPWVSAAALGVLVLHVVSIVADSFVDVSARQAVVPFESPYRTNAVAWGAISLWVLVVVQLTSLLRRHLPRRAWHVIHLSSYIVAVLMTMHAFQSGSDVANPVVALPMVSVLFAAALLTIERAGRRRRGPQPGRVPAPVAVAATEPPVEAAVVVSVDAPDPAPAPGAPPRRPARGHIGPPARVARTRSPLSTRP